MKTEIIKVDMHNPEPDRLSYAADVLRNGGLVAFPTETVYGLGANALDRDAVAGIFTAKGRPPDNPLIIHISQRSAVSDLVSSLPQNAGALMDRFWPGPLTLVLPKSASVPGIVTAGLDTVAIRMPSHPIALALIEKAGVPVAAPSANSSGKPSPTLARHVMDDLSGKVDVIIDGGKVEVGLESTVLDMTTNTPAILRPGGITYEQLKLLLGTVDVEQAASYNETNEAYETNKAGSAVPRSPGMKYRHYAPEAKVIIVQGKLERVVEEIKRLSRQYDGEGAKTGILATDETMVYYTGCGYPACEAISMGSRRNPDTIAANLFESLRYFDGRGVRVIIAEAVENEGIGMAVMNRLNKAAGNHIIRV